jgi:hypothetical protein
MRLTKLMRSLTDLDRPDAVTPLDQIAIGPHMHAQ